MCCGRTTSRPAPTTGAGTGRQQPAPAAPTSWTVTLADGTTRTVRTEIAARLIVGANPGATYTRS